MLSCSCFRCWSYVGKQTGRQLMLLNEECASSEVIMLELGHTIGIFSTDDDEEEVTLFLLMMYINNILGEKPIFVPTMVCKLSFDPNEMFPRILLALRLLNSGHH